MYLALSPLQFCGVSLTRFKEFKALWPYSFVTPMVKGIYYFCKLRGLIDVFNDLCRQISSGVVKTSDESMSAICFHSNPKADLPH